MTAVRVIADDGGEFIYDGATGANYDAQGFVAVITGDEPDTKSVAVWASGRWRRAEVIEDTAPEGPSA